MHDVRLPADPTGTVVSTVVTSVLDELEVDLCSACIQLAGARVWQQRKDTPANRRAVAECLAGIDALLDMYLDSRPGPAHRPLDPRPRVLPRPPSRVGQRCEG